jgi:hypothetical protein
MGNHSAPANSNDAATLASITVRWEDLAPHDFITSPSSAKEPIVVLGDDSLNFQPEFPVFLQAGIVSGTSPLDDPRPEHGVRDHPAAVVHASLDRPAALVDVEP